MAHRSLPNTCKRAIAWGIAAASLPGIGIAFEMAVAGYPHRPAPIAAVRSASPAVDPAPFSDGTVPVGAGRPGMLMPDKRWLERMRSARQICSAPL